MILHRFHSEKVGAHGARKSLKFFLDRTKCAPWSIFTRKNFMKKQTDESVCGAKKCVMRVASVRDRENFRPARAVLHEWACRSCPEIKMK
jgi:hypothetical protein